MAFPSSLICSAAGASHCTSVCGRSKSVSCSCISVSFRKNEAKGRNDFDYADSSAAHRAQHIVYGSLAVSQSSTTSAIYSLQRTFESVYCAAAPTFFDARLLTAASLLRHKVSVVNQYPHFRPSVLIQYGYLPRYVVRSCLGSGVGCRSRRL